jgi:hypothetical protein
MSSPATNDGPQVIVLTDEERDSGVMGDKSLYDAIEAFFTDGCVVVENAIDLTLVDKLNERMLQDTKKLLSGEGEPFFMYDYFVYTLFFFVLVNRQADK